MCRADRTHRNAWRVEAGTLWARTLVSPQYPLRHFQLPPNSFFFRVVHSLPFLLLIVHPQFVGEDSVLASQTPPRLGEEGFRP